MIVYEIKKSTILVRFDKLLDEPVMCLIQFLIFNF